jgi:hypothetical protein
MSDKRPIKAFYIAKEKPKRNISQKSTRHLLSHGSQVSPSSPSFTFIDELYPHDSIPYLPFGRVSAISNLSQRENSSDSSSKLSSRESFLSKNSLKDKEKSKKEDRRRCLPIGIALCIALCLIAVVILLAIILSKKGKLFFLNNIN